jgi:hypothetical protein
MAKDLFVEYLIDSRQLVQGGFLVKFVTSSKK